MKILVKICGLKTKQAALASAKYGADFLGFNFVFSSKRKITPSSAKEIILLVSNSIELDTKIKKSPLFVAVFMDQPAEYINQILSQVKFDLLQFHGKESPEFCASFNIPYIKAFGVGRSTLVSDLSTLMKKYRAKYFMLDRQDRGKGAVIDLKKVKQLAAKFPVILAGGLTPENVRPAILNAGKIKAVDVAGGVETNAKKSIKKIREFIDKTKI